MDAVKLAKKIVSERYGMLSLPSVMSPGFLSLIRGTRQLLDQITDIEDGLHRAKSFSISFKDGDSASTDEKLNVKIPAWYCYTEALEKFLGRPLNERESASVSLVIINGSSIHEGLHVAHSRQLFTSTIRSLINSHKNVNLFSYLLNVTEDLKNESKLEIPSKADFFEFINAKNEIFFSPEKLQHTLQEAMDKYGEDDVKSVALEILVFAKCKGRREQIFKTLNEFGLTDVVNLLTNAATPRARSIDIAEDLYKIFVTTEAANSEKRMDQKEAEEAAEEVEELAKTDEKMLASIEEQKIETGDGAVPPVEEIDVMRNPYPNHESYGRTLVSHKFGFLKNLKVSRQIVPTLREPKTRGTQLVNTRISRIVTDGKIFTSRGTSVASMQKKQPEFIVLVDFSGSMSSIIGTVNETARNMAKAMLDCDITFAVYGHTSATDKDIPAVYHVFSHRTNGKNDTKIDDHFNAVKRVQLRENFDGHAIQYVSKKFNKTAKNKVLIVLSDGAPSGPNYRDSMKHTQESIEKARKNGIKVISLSLTAHVIKSNDRLYGSKFNVDATTQSKLETGMQSIIMGS
jgi:hypothetical protein